jgi:predicted esterase
MATYARRIETQFKSTYYSDRADSGVLIYVPQVDITADFQYVVACHGAGGNSDSSSGPNFTKLINDGFYPKYLFTDNANPNYIVICPQLPRYQQDWPASFIQETVDHVKTIIAEINSQKLIVSGWSQGGRGCYEFIKAYPSRTAGIIPFAAVEGGIIGDTTTGSSAMGGGASVWLFHDAGDPTVGVGNSDNAYNYLDPAAPEKVRYTRYSTSSHDCWTKTLNGTGGSTNGGDSAYPDGSYNIHDWTIDTYGGTGGGGGTTDGEPTITLNGSNPMNLIVGDTYNEPGATADDPEDGALAVTITGTVDTSTAGTYVLTYSAESSTGQQVSTTRDVIVSEDTGGGGTGTYETVLTTFDNFVNAESSGAGQLNETVSGNNSTEDDGANFYPVFADRDYHVTWDFGPGDITYDVDFHREAAQINLSTAVFGLSVRNTSAFRIDNGALTHVVSVSDATQLRISVMAAENGGNPVLKKSIDGGSTFTAIYNFGYFPGTPLVGAVRFKENTAAISNLKVYYDTSDIVTPTLLNPLPDATAVETLALEYLIPVNTFAYLEGTTSDLTLSASGLPAWATFTDNGDGSGKITGTPAVGQAGAAHTVEITATAPNGSTKSDTILLNVYSETVLDIIGFTASTQTPQEGDSVTFTPLKTSGFTRFNWQLPGSSTASADGTEVTVTYSTRGEYQVTMYAVIDELSSIKIVKPFDFITVFPNLKNPNHYVDIPAGTRVTADGTTLGVQAGQVVCLRNTGTGTPGSLILTNFVGTEANPVYLTNPSGIQVEIAYDSTDGLRFEHCRHIREAYVNGLRYGLYIEHTGTGGGPQSHAIIGNSYDHRTYGVELGRQGFAGFMSKNDPNMYSGAYNRDTGFTMWGRWLKHCKADSNGNRITGLGRTGHEHVYFGHFQLEEIEGSSHYMPDCQVAYNEFKDSGRDNVQIGCVGPSEDCFIYHNICNGAGLEGIGSHMQNLALNEGFGGAVFGNICSGAAEQFMDLHPYGNTFIFNNVFHGHGYIRIEESSFDGWVDGTGTTKTISCNLHFINNTAVNCQSPGGVEGVLLRAYASLGDPFTALTVDNNAYTYLNSGNLIASMFDGRAVGANNVGRTLGKSGEMGFINHDSNQRLLPDSILRTAGADLSSIAIPAPAERTDVDDYPYPDSSGVWFTGAYSDTQQTNYGTAPTGEAPSDPNSPESGGIRTSFFGIVGRY